jgi:hypothetical protein
MPDLHRISGEKVMKEILASFVLTIAIAVGAAYVLKAMDWSSARTYTSQRGDVRL